MFKVQFIRKNEVKSREFSQLDDALVFSAGQFGFVAIYDDVGKPVDASCKPGWEKRTRAAMDRVEARECVLDAVIDGILDDINTMDLECGVMAENIDASTLATSDIRINSVYSDGHKKSDDFSEISED